MVRCLRSVRCECRPTITVRGVLCRRGPATTASENSNYCRRLSSSSFLRPSVCDPSILPSPSPPLIGADSPPSNLPDYPHPVIVYSRSYTTPFDRDIAAIFLFSRSTFSLPVQLFLTILSCLTASPGHTTCVRGDYLSIMAISNLR